MSTLPTPTALGRSVDRRPGGPRARPGRRRRGGAHGRARPRRGDAGADRTAASDSIGCSSSSTGSDRPSSYRCTAAIYLERLSVGRSARWPHTPVRERARTAAGTSSLPKGASHAGSSACSGRPCSASFRPHRRTASRSRWASWSPRSALHAPAALLLGFVPIFCMTIAEREFVAREPDAGTVFVWVGKSLGPRLGWIASWALLAATFIALANLANITGKYFFLLIDANGAANTPLGDDPASGARGWRCRPTWVCAAWRSPRARRSCCSRRPCGAGGVRGGRGRQADRRHRGLAGDRLLLRLAEPRLDRAAAERSPAVCCSRSSSTGDGTGRPRSSRRAVAERTRRGSRSRCRRPALLACYLVITIVMEAFAGVGYRRHRSRQRRTTAATCSRWSATRCSAPDSGHLMKFAVHALCRRGADRLGRADGALDAVDGRLPGAARAVRRVDQRDRLAGVLDDRGRRSPPRPSSWC